MGFFFFKCQAYIYYFISFLQEPYMVSILQLSEKDSVAQRGSITEPRAEAILPRAGQSHGLSIPLHHTSEEHLAPLRPLKVLYQNFSKTWNSV